MADENLQENLKINKKKVKEKKKKAPKKQRRANNFIFFWIRFWLRPILWLWYRVRFNKKSSRGIKRPCLILCNHQTGFDQFANGVGFKFGINYVASDTIFRHGFTSWLMRVLSRPIPFTKGTSDPVAVKAMMQAIADGGAVGIFPEGNRSYYGESMPFKAGTGRLAKKLNVPLVLCNIKGGYLTKPRWKKKPNKGIVLSEVVRVVSVDELKELTAAEVDAIIEKTLYVNDFEFALSHNKPYKGSARAEHLEGLLFYCPNCNQTGGLFSKKHDVFCKHCDLKATVNTKIHFEYNAQRTMHNAQCTTSEECMSNSAECIVQNAECRADVASGGIKRNNKNYNKNAPNDNNNSALCTLHSALPKNILEWARLQQVFVDNFNEEPFADTPIFTDENATLSKVEYAKKQTGGIFGTLAMYNNRIVACGEDFYFDTLKAVTVTESRKLSIYTKDGTAYAIDVPRRTNVIKYKQFFEKIVEI